MNDFEAKRVQSSDSIDYTPSSAIAAGEVVLIGAIAGVSANDIAADELGSLRTEGIFDVKKAGGAGVTFAAGDVVDWDTANDTAIATGGAGTPIGRAIGAAADGDTAVRVWLNKS